MATTPLARLQHDQTVRQWALNLVWSGYDVRARVEGWFESPDYIYEYRPDIVARKGDWLLIVEVKKSESDWPKIEALERFVQQHEHTKVLVILPGDAPNQGAIQVDDNWRPK